MRKAYSGPSLKQPISIGHICDYGVFQGRFVKFGARGDDGEIFDPKPESTFFRFLLVFHLRVHAAVQELHGYPVARFERRGAPHRDAPPVATDRITAPQHGERGESV